MLPKRSFTLALSLFLLSASAPAGTLSLSANSYNVDPVELKDLGSMPFSNRAACGADSKKPAQSAFLIVDSYNAGKLLDSWLQGSNPNETQGQTVESGLKFFRLSLTETWTTIAQELLSGRLPLLAAQPDKKDNSRYAEIFKACANRYPCEAMDSYLGEIFTQWKTLPDEVKNPYKSYFEIDDFAKRPELLKGRRQPQASCIYVKRFSALQSHWSKDRPDQGLLQKIGMAAMDKDNLYTSCFDESDDVSSRRFMLQLDVSEVQRHAWNQHGFDFWHSLKIYFAYAWRHPEFILETQDQPLTQLFKNLSVEQMMSLVSNSCKSIERPGCTQSQVSMDIFRSLAKMGAPTEVDKPLPDRPEQLLLSQPLSVKHDDEAVLPEADSAENWIKGYQERILQRRGLLKQRLLLAISQFELLSKALSTTRTSAEVQRLVSEMKNDRTLYQKIHVLCNEVDTAANPAANMLEKRFQTTLKIEKFRALVEGTTDQSLEDMVNFYMNMAKSVLPICNQISATKGWDSNIPLPYPSFSAWYRDLFSMWDAPVSTGETKPATPDFLGMGEYFNKATLSGKPYLTQEKVNANGVVETSTVCADASDCVRMLLKSMVDLYSVSAWADALMPVNEWIQSPALANPWAEATACQVYDPWFATKQAVVGLFGDIASTTLSGIYPVPGYLAAQPKHRDVKGFEVEARGDEVFLKPVKRGPHADVTVGVDLGPWIGIPCSIVGTPTANRPILPGNYNVSRLSATIGYCKGKDGFNLQVNDGGSAGDAINQKKSYSFCAMCNISPYTVLRGASIIASMGTPPLRIAVGVLFSGISLAKRLMNPIDIPHRWKVNVEEVAKTFDKYSFIPKRCVKRLSHGKSCQRVTFTRKERNGQRGPEETSGAVQP